MSVLGVVFSVLMVGHSLFGTDGPDMLQEALRAGQGQGTVVAQIINGAPLRNNWEDSATAEGVDARAVLPNGGISHLILTEAIPLANHVTWSDTEVYAQAFFGLAASSNPQVHVYLQETWHSLNSGTGAAIDHDNHADIPWRTRLDLDLPVWEGIVDKVTGGNRIATAQMSLIPAGQAMGRLYDEIAAGRVPGVDAISVAFDDDIHLSDLGHYFVAMVQYATLTGEDPLGLPAQFNDRWGKPFAAPDEDLARQLQRIAWDAVRAYQGTTIAPVPPALPGRAIADQVKAVKTGQPVTPLVLAAPAGAVAGTNAVAVGLAGVSDWAVQLPFLDLMKSARPWLGHKPGQYGGMGVEDLRAGGYLDANGWPLKMPRELSSIGTMILTDMPEAAVSLKGRYRLRFDGAGVIEVTGRAGNIRYGKGEVTFDYSPGPGSVEVRIQRINTTNPPRNISVVRADRAKLLDSGGIFNPDWTSRIAPFSALRFMDWMDTNNSAQSTWEARPRPTDSTFAAHGVPVEILVALANELKRDAWFNMPHRADDAYVRAFASYVQEHLDPGLKAYVEYSNEVWNWQFDQARWADEQARARWGQKDKWIQFFALRAAEIARIWTEVYGDRAEAGLVNVISTQTGWLGLENDILMAPMALSEGLPPPVDAFDAYAVTGYFGGIMGVEAGQKLVKGWLAASAAEAAEAARAAGLSGQAADDFVETHRYDAADVLAAQDLRDGSVSGDAGGTLADLIGRVWPYHAAVARAQELDLVMYEGGTHLVGIGPLVDDEELTAFLQHFNYTPQMGALYTTLLEGWEANGGQLFNAFSDVYAPTKWGSWGALRHLDDQNPRWDALMAFQ